MQTRSLTSYSAARSLRIDYKPLGKPTPSLLNSAFGCVKKFLGPLGALGGPTYNGVTVPTGPKINMRLSKNLGIRGI